MTTLGEKKLCTYRTPFLGPLFVGIREVQERVSERIEKVPRRYVDGTLKASRVAERGRKREIGNSVVVCVCVWCVCVCVLLFIYSIVNIEKPNVTVSISISNSHPITHFCFSNFRPIFRNSFLLSVAMAWLQKSQFHAL